jgi:uncharacterized protein (DUF983 family)
MAAEVGDQTADQAADHVRRTVLSHPAPSLLAVGLKSRCPRCGEGKLFSGFLTIAKKCDRCGLDYDFADAGDGPAVLIILFVGFIVVGLALVVEVAFSPPFIVHALLWLPLLLILSLGLLRPMKSVMIAIQYASNSRESELD